MFNILDITSYKEKGQELHDRIVKVVKSYAKSKLIIELPNKLVMTQKQYDDLSLLSGMYDVYYTEDKMYQTPYSVMEIRVVDRTRATFKETMELDDKQFEEWEKRNGVDKDE